MTAHVNQFILTEIYDLRLPVGEHCEATYRITVDHLTCRFYGVMVTDDVGSSAYLTPDHARALKIQLYKELYHVTDKPVDVSIEMDTLKEYSVEISSRGEREPSISKSKTSSCEVNITGRYYPSDWHKQKINRFIERSFT